MLCPVIYHKTLTSKIYKTKTEVPEEERYRHENFCTPIIDCNTWERAQFLLNQRSEINPRASSGRKLHRYSGLIKCAECGSHFIAKTRLCNGKKYVEYTCNSNHRYGKKYCTPHRIRGLQLDELVFDEVQNLKEKVIEESEKFEDIIKKLTKQKPVTDLQIKQYDAKITALKQQIEDLIMERISDKSRVEFYNSMIEKRENEITELQRKISECREYDKVCKQRQQMLTNTYALLDDILSEESISDANLRMLVKSVTVHQNEDKSLDIHFDMNGDFKNEQIIFLEPQFESALV